MGEAYPELPRQRDLIMKVIKEEEDSFLRTLENGIRMLDDSIAAAKAQGKNEISGKEAFTLYDTYGFPLDLTQLILKENGMTLNQKEFDVEMEAQKSRARNAAAVEATDWVTVNDGEQEFVGYDVDSCDARILRYRHVKQKNKEYYQIVLDRTPFYAEMGGQTGDHGTLTSPDGEVVEIYDTKRENGMGVHLTTKLPSDVNATFKAAINSEDRIATSCNHTATHLLHEALREVLGTHVEQKGSYVSPHMLRFDFSHFSKLTPEEIKKVERLANKKVREAIARDERRNVPIAEAMEMGAMALFGEKYGEEVRVIRYGDSVELCGGTHVDNTGRIGMIKIINESSIAAGIRRIEAITGAAVEDAMDEVSGILRDIKNMLNAPDVVGALRKTVEENADLRRQAEEYMRERIDNIARQILETAEIIDGVKVATMRGMRLPDVVKGVAFAVRAFSPEKTAFIAATCDASDKPLLTVMFTNDLTEGGALNASNVVRQAAKSIKGGGGGQPGFAQAGGKDKDGLSAAFDTMINSLKH